MRRMLQVVVALGVLDLFLGSVQSFMHPFGGLSMERYSF